MSSYKLFYYGGGSNKPVLVSKTSTVRFQGLEIGSNESNGLVITDSGGNFDFNAKKLANVAAGTASGHAVEYDQFNTAVGAKISTSEKGVASGVCPLDSSSKIASQYLPADAMEFKGAYNATANIPFLSDVAIAASKIIQDLTYTAKVAGAAGNLITIAYTNSVTQGNEVATRVGNAITVTIESGVSTATQVKAAIDAMNLLVDVVISGTAGNAQVTVGATNLLLGQDLAGSGDFYRVSVAGTQNFGGGAQTFVVGDYVMFSGTLWEKGHAGSDQVNSVNSKTGVIVLNTDDISEFGTPTNKWFTDVRAKAAAVANTITDGVTDVAPSQNAVFDALAGKSDTGHNHSGVYAPVVHSHSVGDVTGFDAAALSASVQSGAITNGVTKAPTHDAVYDALALKSDSADNKITRTNADAADFTAAFKVGYCFSNTEVKLVRADTANLQNYVKRLVISSAAVAASAEGSFYAVQGQIIRGLSGLTLGDYFVDLATAGNMVTTAPVSNNVLKVGSALSASEFMFNPEHIVDLGAA